jgi:hypothetical protein
MALNKITAFKSQVRDNSTSETPVIKSTRISDNQVVRIANIPVDQENVTVRKTTSSNKFFASKLLNYVESVNISGFPKTVFYSELATNFNIGDRVYILNGFYDSADFISKDKYTEYTDGYRVLGVDGCRIILDLDYTGQLPYTDFNLEDLIFVHHITTQAQFDYVNSIRIGISQSGFDGVYSAFLGSGSGGGALSIYGRNIIFVSKSFLRSTDVLNPSGGISLTEPGFYAKVTNGDWISVSNGFGKGSFFDGNSSTNPNNSFLAEKIVIIGEDFVYDDYPSNGQTTTFRERQVYKFDRTKLNPTSGINGLWVFDKEYKQPVISKLNFRYGNFKGTHNDGVFGSYDKVPKWNSATWNSGFFVNSTWNSGAMDTKSTNEKSYSAKLSVSSGITKAIQNVDFSNNRGFGFNYVIDSEIKESVINKGNFENSNIGLTLSLNIIDNYYNGSMTYSVSSNFVNYNFCDIYTTYVSNGLVSDSIIENSQIFKSKSVNNQIVDSVVESTQYNSDGGIGIIGADIWGYDYDPGNVADFNTIRGTLKLYISDKDFLRLEKGDSFYLEKINKDYYVNSLSTNEKIQLPIETRYILDYYTDYELYESDGILSKVSVSLKPKTNNYDKYYVSSQIVSTQTLYEEPNTVSTVNSGGGETSTYWTLIENYRRDWIPERSYTSGDFVIHIGGLYSYSGLTDSNNEPQNPPPTEDWGWYTQSTPLQWSSLTINSPGEYVFAKTSTGETYSLFLCNTSTSDTVNIGLVAADSIKMSTLTVDVLTKSQTVDSNSRLRYSSIDIESDSFGWYFDPNRVKTYTSDVITKNSGISKIPINQIDRSFVNTYLKPSDFRSGVFKSSTWLSGHNVNYYGNIIKKNSEKLQISYESPSRLRVTLKNFPHNYYQTIKGFDIKKGDSVWLNGVSYTGTSSEVSLSGRYTVVQEPNRVLNSDYLDIVITPKFITASFSSASLTYSVFGAEGNTYTSLSKFSIEDSIINYGFFKRTQMKNTIISNDQFDNNDSTFNLSNVNLLRLINILFKSNNITLNDGIFYRSHIIESNFNLGIVHNSVWNGATFSNGIFSAGSWQSGNFISGKFIDSKDKIPSTDYHNDKITYKGWLGGTFQTGEFVNSVWLDGTFNNGKFYKSDFYGGVWNNGILGSKNIGLFDTTFGYYAKLDGVGVSQSIWNYGVVENAIMGGDGIVYWYDGKFNSGEFTSNGATSENESIWYNGEFNGSKITKLARWKNGVFNSGKFWSYYGWENVGPTLSSDNPSDYSWENGKFNSGEFGYKGLTSNSVWFNGQFYGGDFLGRFWKNGYFLSGNFFGSGLKSGINSVSSSLDEYNFADSFTSSYYGIWNNGFVVQNIKEVSGQEGLLVNQKRAVQIGSSPDNRTTFNNILWLGGTFSHNNAVINDSLWLSGSFVRGEFNGGVFNPYVDRDFTGSFSNSSFGTTSYWNNGDFLTGSFWSADWRRGTFKNGYMSGARWYDGTFEYGTAENVYWLNGTWRNGNWNGSPYDYTYITMTESNDSNRFGGIVNGVTISVNYMTPGREKDVILKVASYNDANTSSTQSNIHLLNIFSVSNTTTVFVNNVNNTDGFTWSSTDTYTGTIVVGTGKTKQTKFSTLSRSYWDESSGFNIVTSKNLGYLKTSTGTVSAYIPISIPQAADKNIVTVGGTNSSFTDLGYEGYNIYKSSVDTPPSSKLFAYSGGTTSTFTASSVSYTIKLTVAVELVKTVEVECFIGGLSSSIFKLDSDFYNYTKLKSYIVKNASILRETEYQDYYAKVYTINLTYNTSAISLSETDGKKFAIRKNSNGILRILKSEVYRRNITYHPDLNNFLYNGINLLTQDILFPATSSVSLTTVSSNGYEIGTNFGNGVFKSGIWENGVWNNGYRSNEWFNESDYILASDIVYKETYKVSNNTWKITLQCYNSFRDENDVLIIDKRYKISIGNIINIDVNGKRTFLRDPMKITNIDDVNRRISFEYVSNFEIREIKKDSDLHLIYITQNIWQNGVFLNGYFSGVWSNGVFKGYPRTTEMVDSHWVTGYFEGGHFKSNKILENRNEDLPEYNTGLAQSITFKDRNVAYGTFSAYESWVDVNYSTQSNVNLNTYTKVIGISQKSQKVVESYLPNLSGYPTSDILSSDSYFRNSKTPSIRRYSLGIKYQEYENFLKSQGNFNVPLLNPTNYTFPVNSDESKISQKIKSSEFFSQGWTYSLFERFNNSTVGYVVSSNINELTSQRLKLSIESIVYNGGEVNGLIFFNLYNTKVITKPERYYVAEIILSQTYSLGGYLSDNTTNNAYQTYLHDLSKKRSAIEYFYNTPTMDFSLFYLGGKGASFSFEKISFYEVDSIPFFKYYKTDSEIDLSIKNPYVGTAPIIDYTNKNFDFVGNVELGIDYRTIVQQNSFSSNQIGRFQLAQYNPVIPSGPNSG